MGDAADQLEDYEYRQGMTMIAEARKGTNMSESTDEIRATGKIIKVSDTGWGFISSKDIKFTRIFFHWTSLVQDTLKFTELRNGMKVEFTPVEVEGKGFRAIRIRIIQDELQTEV
jgi:cold shock CspA family protein